MPKLTFLKNSSDTIQLIAGEVGDKEVHTLSESINPKVNITGYTVYHKSEYTPHVSANI